MKRVLAKDASTGEKLAALTVSGMMKTKRKLSKKPKKPKITGAGLNEKKKNKITHITFNKLIKNAKKVIDKSKPETLQAAINLAMKSVEKSKKGKEIRTPRKIKTPKYTGGILPLIPFFAALGSVVGGTSTVVNAINNYKAAQRELKESKRHNGKMEAIALGKGYYLKANRNGSGFYLKQPKNH